MSNVELLVDGLNCGGCVKTLTTQLEAVPGVLGVSIDLVSGGTSTVHVTSTTAIGPADLEAAVIAAGKRMASALPV
jgi:copper chaperone CopZ